MELRLKYDNKRQTILWESFSQDGYNFGDFKLLPAAKFVESEIRGTVDRFNNAHAMCLAGRGKHSAEHIRRCDFCGVICGSSGPRGIHEIRTIEFLLVLELGWKPAYEIMGF